MVSMPEKYLPDNDICQNARHFASPFSSDIYIQHNALSFLSLLSQIYIYRERERFYAYSTKGYIELSTKTLNLPMPDKNMKLLFPQW